MVNVYSKLPKLQYVHHIVVGYWEKKKNGRKAWPLKDRQLKPNMFHVLLDMQ